MEKKKKIILIAGEINSGKNHAFSLLKAFFEEKDATVHHIFFAKKLKELCEYTFERYTEHLNTIIDRLTKDLHNHHKEEDINSQITLLNSLKIAPHNWYEDKTESTRLILQDIGTRFARENVDTDFWPKKVMSDIAHSEADLYIATDFRFPNEHAVLLKHLSEKYDIVTIKIERNVGTDSFISNHPSEQALNKFSFDYTIDNSGTLEEFEKKLQDLFAKLE